MRHRLHAKIVVDCTVLGKVSNFKYLDCNVPYITNNDVVKMLHKLWDQQQNSKINE